ncbi:cation acetate symporter [Arthrobacter jiangjiafuii]|uniref:Cation acetate symporter n=1 Tax=Arthrobacter jiangjiafuii TaxID=2817475 RepID=A0A975M7W6_9MICC|nr:cation acetate symporter [Arthrobacter jiangjiafuii]MBP3044065.1 cation acetate symporter [Arthrobacter jiangjiafuii]QWC11051.1 cation acetate symporter [Arthrobacter jiangjiafuii]
MNPATGYAALAAVTAVTLLIGVYGLRISRTTGDFYVASRTVRPWWNASAIGGEYLSAASFLGVAGLILVSGVDALWFPIGYTAGYLMLLLFVAAPLRRSGAYTVPDFAQARLESIAVRRITSLLVIAVGWLYIVPQLHGAALTIRITTGLPGWVGSVAVAVIVCLSVVTGGMRSITFVQAFQYWLKLAAIAVPVLFVLFRLSSEGLPWTNGGAAFEAALNPETHASLYRNISLSIALLCGTLGLPHVLVRFYTNPDGVSARRTTLIVLGLLSLFYVFPIIYGVLGRIYTPELAAGGADSTVLLLPGRVFDGALGDLLSALVTAGAFAAFLSTTSGLVVSLAGVVSQEFFRGSVSGFRLSAVLAAAVPLGLAALTSSQALAGSVGMVFAFTASTLCPLLVLGIWWRGLTAPGAVAGMVTGAALCGGAMVSGGLLSTMDRVSPVWLEQPAAWTVPAAFAVTVAVSRLRPDLAPSGAAKILARLHTPEPRR